MRRFYYVFFVFWLLIPETASAFIILPTASVVVVVNTVGGEGSFNFQLTDGQLFSQIQNFNIATQNGSGSYTATVTFPSSFGYNLTQDSPTGWQLTSTYCVSSDPANTSTTISNGVHIFLAAFTTTTCTFTNTHQVSKNPILIVPGIMGTEVFKGTEKLWPDINRMLNPFHSDDFMDPLAFKADATPLDNSLSLGMVVRNPSIKFDYLKALIDDLKNQGYIEGVDLFTFPYDWRKDIADIANQNLTGQVDYILNQTSAGQAAGKVDIIAHSQGGLVVKKLLFDQPSYKNKIGKLVFVGVPNLGAPKAAKALLYGDDMGVSLGGVLGLDPEEIKKIGHNMPSVYELLPSQEYFNHTNGYMSKAQTLSDNSPLLHVTTLNSADTTGFLKDSGLNSSLVDRASAFHSPNYDNLDLSTGGMNIYNIVGCQTGTLGKILAMPDGRFKLLSAPGDGTVPIFSANNIPGSTTFYALESSHGTMLTEDGIRQKLVNIITGSANSTNGKITQNASNCHFNGDQVSVHSPVDLNIYDSLGRHVGPTLDGGFDAEIPNVDYEEINHEKYAFLPEGLDYTIKLLATDTGSFSFDSASIHEGEITNTAHYDSIPIQLGSFASVNLNSANNQIIQLDSDGNGTVDANFAPSAFLNAQESLDLTPPLTVASVTGTHGQTGFYRGDISINLNTEDPILLGSENQSSGILKTEFSLDNSTVQIYTGAISLTDEGRHNLKFFSTDKAGNREPEKTLEFTIDKTAPEIAIQFNPAIQDLQFTGTDNISENVSMQDFDDSILLKDQAGNTTSLVLKEKDRKHKLKVEIKQLLYNDVEADIGKNKLVFNWKYLNSVLKSLSQQVKSKRDFNIQAEYNGVKTEIKGKDATGNISQSINGLVLLKLKTNLGDFSWTY